jgi:hypothetical protein
MREDILHYIWKFRRFQQIDLKTIEGRPVSVIHPGSHNHDAGPDFFNARIKIGDQTWAGNVEIHFRSSDWKAHGHHKDKAYDSVILHVVWEHNTKVKRSKGTALETLQLKDYVSLDLVKRCDQLLSSQSWINCESDFKEVDELILNNWLERLFIERLEHKSMRINERLDSCNNDWEQVFFISLFRSFGLSVNADAFESCAQSISFSVVRKIREDLTALEALLFGQLGLLEGEEVDIPYRRQLKSEYEYLKHKFALTTDGVLPLKWSRLRPANFPSVRIAQFASIYHKTPHLLSKILRLQRKEQFYELLQTSPSDFWQQHYHFQTPSKPNKRIPSKRFIDLLIINTFVPLTYVYRKSRGQLESELLIDLMQGLPLEANHIVDRYFNLKSMPKNALVSQGLVQLKNHYCDKNACLSCAVANDLLL